MSKNRSFFPFREFPFSCCAFDIKTEALPKAAQVRCSRKMQHCNDIAQLTEFSLKCQNVIKLEAQKRNIGIEEAFL